VYLLFNARGMNLVLLVCIVYRGAVLRGKPGRVSSSGRRS